MRSVGGSVGSVVDEQGLSSSAVSLSVFRIFTLLLTVKEALSMFIAHAAAPHVAWAQHRRVHTQPIPNHPQGSTPILNIDLIIISRG
jgi:hypothetical protein